MKEQEKFGTSPVKNAYFATEGEFREDGLFYLENGRIIDPNKCIEDEDIEDMTIEEMKINMKKMEDIIIRQYIQLTSTYIKINFCEYCEKDKAEIAEFICKECMETM